MNWLAPVKKFLQAQFNFRQEEDKLQTLDEIVEGVRFRGGNLWVLSLAMIICSIGLTINSSSAIIGAMLMSPLMGPVVGFSFSLAVSDNRLRKISWHNWLLMNVVSIISATLYFLATPYKEDTELLNSFTEATIFDIMLAFFGGMAGFIGILKKDGSKILAGVAVATACMPPLCTAAYGLAHADWHYFLGGLYFYLINSFFIGLATFLLAKYFHFTQNNTAFTNHAAAKWLVYLVMVLLFIPAVYFAHKKFDTGNNMAVMDTGDMYDNKRIDSLEKQVKYLDSLMRKQ